jgi:hypothetical protein
VFLWYDWWHPNGILYDKYGYKPIYDASSSLEAKVKSVLKDAQPGIKPARSTQLVEIE